MAEESFGDWLKHHRLGLGLTQEQLARQLNCSTSMLRKFESEERRPSAETIQQLSDIFAIPPEERDAFLRFARGDWQAYAGGEPENAPWRESKTERPSNLPSLLTSFIGREKEQGEIIALLKKNRLVTLTGAGGVGKTRLALQAAEELQGSYPQGAWLVELASLADPALLPQTVAAVFELRPERDRPIQTVLLEALRTRNLLLVLDNCEHLVEACAALASRLLQACPGLTTLATSREGLDIAGEITYVVPSMTFPERGEKIPLEELLKFEALELFTRRAQAALPGFELSEENAGAVMQICRHLDGIPLALELAAARLRAMEVEQIVSQLEDRFRLLSGGDRTAPPRMKTMRASIDWSYQLLPQAEMALLRRLSVFAGGWSLAAAGAVCADETLPEADIPDLLGRLVDKSLVQVLRRQGHALRYRLLETLRQYGQEKLLDGGEQPSMRDRHLAYFVSLAEQAGPGLEGPNSVTWLRRLEDELDNLRLALEWAQENNMEAGICLASPIWRFWELLGRTREHCDWLTRLLDRPEAHVHPLVRAHALGIKAYDLFELGDMAQAQVCAEMSLALSREIGDKQGEAFSLFVLSLFHQGEASARQLLEQSLALYRMLADKAGQARALHELSHGNQNDVKRAHALALEKESLALYREAGDQIGIALQLYEVADTLIKGEDYPTAWLLIEEALSMQRQLGLKGEIPYSLTEYGRLAYWQGNWQQARAYLEESIALFDEIGLSGQGIWPCAQLAYVLLRQGELAQARLRFVEGLKRTANVGTIIATVFVLEGLASLAVAESRPERAAALFAWAEEMRRTIGDVRQANEQAEVDRDLAAIRAQLDEATLQAAQAAGRAMTLEEAIAFAQNDQDG